MRTLNRLARFGIVVWGIFYYEKFGGDWWVAALFVLAGFVGPSCVQALLALLVAIYAWWTLGWFGFAYFALMLVAIIGLGARRKAIPDAD